MTKNQAAKDKAKDWVVRQHVPASALSKNVRLAVLDEYPHIYLELPDFKSVVSQSQYAAYSYKAWEQTADPDHDFWYPPIYQMAVVAGDVVEEQSDVITTEDDPPQGVTSTPAAALESERELQSDITSMKEDPPEGATSIHAAAAGPQLQLQSGVTTATEDPPQGATSIPAAAAESENESQSEITTAMNLLLLRQPPDWSFDSTLKVITPMEDPPQGETTS